MNSSAVFTIFGIRFTSFGLMCALAFLVLFVQMAIQCIRNRGNVNSVAIFGLLAVPMVLVISRIVFVLSDILYYVEVAHSFAAVFRFWEGGFSFMGGLIGILLAAFVTDRIYEGRNRKYFLTDSAALALPFAIAVERIGEYGTGMGMGKAVYTPWMEAIAIPDSAGILVHQVYFYEAAAALVIGIVMWIYCAHKKSALVRGDTLNIFMALFGCCQITLESLRKDGHMVVHFVRIQQIIALLMAIFALIRWAEVIKKSGRLKKSTIATMCAIVLVCVLLMVKQEFAVDSSENPWMDYGIMAFSALILCTATLIVGKLAGKDRVDRKSAII